MRSFDALVVGGGVSGIRAILDLAEMNYKVCLVEKDHYIGGKVAKITKTFPNLENPREDLVSEMKELESNPNIELMTNTRVLGCDGSLNNFSAKVLHKARFVNDSCDACGKCSEVCPEDVPNAFNGNLDNRKAIYIPFSQAVPNLYAIDEDACTKCEECVKVCPKDAIDLSIKDIEEDIGAKTVILSTGYDLFEPEGLYGYGDYKDVITSMQLIRMSDTEGPTKGKIIRPSNGEEVKDVGFILCVGSRDVNYNPYCSNYCCTFTIKNALELKEKDPSRNVYVIYMDIRTPFKGAEELYRRARESGVKFLRGRPATVKEDDGKIKVSFFENFIDKELELNLDLLVLAEASLPSKDSKELAKLFGIDTDDYGFFAEKNSRLAPLKTKNKGILICGCAQGLKDISLSVSQGSAAAARASALLSQLEL
ncbi:MAG: CoB--CoM heterodisulfide reductase iron-sulfur subunit A [Candidatus Methanolliviera sp. GoM_asphalt]|nr:MAG: CoB--CoM heterodisulfide reductase iron-sulfur subunit A [Candidatus Methanolliviera sp. GoM_asphalt]